MKGLKPQFFFYLLSAYVLAQFTWWAYLLITLNGEFFSQQQALVELGYLPEVSGSGKNLRNRQLMIIGEGLVFFTLLLIGLYITLKSIRREVLLAQQQRNFLLSVTHELKTPIASARLYLETLLKRDLQADQRKGMLTKAISDTQRLNAMVENLLLATRVEGSNEVFTMETFDLSRHIADQMYLLEQTLGQQHITDMQIQNELWIDADETAVTSIISNLYENAVKYAPAGTTIAVKLQKAGNMAELSVSDEGPGIPESERHKVFEKFYRSGQEDTRKTKGTGLGLYIVSQITQKHKGVIFIADSSKGTRVVVKLPLANSR